MTGFRRFQLVSGSFWVVLGGFGWFQLVSDGFMWFQVILGHSSFSWSKDGNDKLKSRRFSIHGCIDHGTIMRTGICKKISCYMRDSAYRWFILKKAEIFQSYVNIFEFSRLWENVEFKLFWNAKPISYKNMKCQLPLFRH